MRWLLLGLSITALLFACVTPPVHPPRNWLAGEENGVEAPEYWKHGSNLYEFSPLIKANSYRIPRDRYDLRSFLRGYEKYMRDSTVVELEQPFWIQTGEVTVADFRLYVEQGLSEEKKRELGTWWEFRLGKEIPPQSPVRWVDQEMASDYAKWLSRRTGWNLRLPSTKEWIAAVILYGENSPVLRGMKQPRMELRQKPDHLLGNLREWSRNDCRTLDGNNGFQTLGENYMTGTDFGDRGNAYCLPGKSGPGIGFRLVRYPE